MNYLLKLVIKNKIFIILFILNIYNHSLAINLHDNFSSALLVNAYNGEILYDYNKLKKIYPASLTKMMTAYVIFDAIENNSVDLHDKVQNANFTTYDLLMKMIIKSDNEAANILANNIYHSYDFFINKMNEWAEKLNLKNTHFQNPSGLFDENNYSTSEDMARLAIRLEYDFPHYVSMFKVNSLITNDDNVMTKTGNLDHSILNAGYTGKSGYISQSGYNMAIWQEKKDKMHIFLILIGTQSPQSRNDFINYFFNLSEAKTKDNAVIKTKNDFEIITIDKK